MATAPSKASTPKTCANCVAWIKDDRDQNCRAAFAGCARTGKTTSSGGEDRFVHYTTDLQTCSLWEAK